MAAADDLPDGCPTVGDVFGPDTRRKGTKLKKMDTRRPASKREALAAIFEAVAGDLDSDAKLIDLAASDALLFEHFPLHATDLAACLRRWHENGTRSVLLQEFLACGLHVTSVASRGTVFDRIRDRLQDKMQRTVHLFREMDASGDGQIDHAELRAGLKGVGFDATEKEFAEIVKVLDKDNDGTVSVGELIKTLKDTDFARQKAIQDKGPSRCCRALTSD